MKVSMGIVVNDSFGPFFVQKNLISAWRSNNSLITTMENHIGAVGNMILQDLIHFKQDGTLSHE